MSEAKGEWPKIDSTLIRINLGLWKTAETCPGTREFRGRHTRFRRWEGDGGESERRRTSPGPCRRALRPPSPSRGIAGRFVARRENVLISGPMTTGKSHLARSQR